VEDALGVYYAEKVRKVVFDLWRGPGEPSGAGPRSPDPDEWAIRRWFERRLITERGSRGVVVHDSPEFHEVGDRAVRLLVDSYLVREDVRPAGKLYELAHDRLIGPILRDNKPWRDLYQGLLQIRATVWQGKGKPADAYLLSEQELTESKEWARANRSLMRDVDDEYLAVCEDYHRKRDRKRRRERHLKLLLFVAGLLVLTLTLAALAVRLSKANSDLYQANGALLKQNADLEKANERNRALQAVLDKRQLLAGILELIPADPERSLASAKKELDDLHEILVKDKQRDALPPMAFEAERRGVDILHRALHAQRTRATWRGHKAEANAVAYDASGDRVASAGSDRQGDRPEEVRPGVIIRDASTGDVTHELVHGLAHRPDGPGWVAAVAFHPKDRNRLFTATSHGAFAWTLPGAGGRPTREQLPQSRDGLYALAVDRDGRRVAAAGEKGWVQVWTIADDGTPRAPWQYRHEGATTTVYGLAFGGPSGSLTSAGSDGSIRFWRATADREDPVARLDSVTGSGFRGVAWSADGSRVASAGEDGTVQVWSVRDGRPPEPQRILHASPDRINGVAFSHDGEFLATAGRDGLVKVWDVAPNVLGTLTPGGATAPTESRVPIGILAGHTKIVTGVAFHPTNYSLASSSDDHTVKVWNVSGDGNCFAPITLRKRTTRRVALSPDGKRFAAAWGSATDDGVLVWSVPPVGAPGRPPGTDDAGWGVPEQRVTALAFSHDGRLLVTGTELGKVSVWNVAAKKPVPLPTGDLGKNHTVTGVAVHPTGNWVAACTFCRAEERESRVAVWDLSLPDNPPVWVENRLAIFDVAFDPDGRRLVIAGNDRVARVWALSDYLEKKPPERPEKRYQDATAHSDPGTFYEAAFSPDGRRLAVACGDGSTRLWDLGAPDRPPLRLGGHKKGVRCLAFDTNGTRVISGGYDRTVSVWDLYPRGSGAEPLLLYTLTGPAGAIGEVRPVSGRVAVLSFDGSVRFYDLDYGSLRDRAAHGITDPVRYSEDR
jgi:WD40 repeat protein